MDFGKFKYESDMKAREARRNQTNTVLKEIRFRLKIDAHDYETKKGHVVRFLEGGDKVKVMIMFRGREQSRPEMGVRLLTRLAEGVSHLGTVESMPKQDGRNMTMVLGPLKKKADAKAEQRKRADEINSQRMTKTEARRAAAGPADDEVEVEVEVELEAQQPEAVAEVEPAEETVSFQETAAAAVAAAAQASAAQASAARPAPAPPAPAPQPSVAPQAPQRTTRPAAKPATAPRPAAAKPAAAPAAPRPAAAPKPAVAKPAAPRPAAPKPGAAPKPAPKPSPRAPRSS